MTKNNSNIDDLFENEKNSTPELSSDHLMNLIEQFPNNSTPPKSIINLKNIVMISIPTAVIISALTFLPTSNKMSQVNNESNNLKTEKNIGSLASKTKEEKILEIPIIVAGELENDSTIDHSTPSTASINIPEQINTTQSSNSQKQSSKKNTEPDNKSILTKEDNTKEKIKTGSQISSPQSTINKPSISAMEARRLKKLLYKNLIKDEIISSKKSYVEIQLLLNSIIVNDIKLKEELFNKYQELTAEAGSGKNHMIKMNPEYIKIGEFTDKGFKGIGVGRFQAEFPIITKTDPIESNNSSSTFATDSKIAKGKKTKLEIEDAMIKEEKLKLNKFINSMYADQNRTFKRGLFDRYQISYKNLLKLHDELYQLAIRDGYANSNENNVVFELGETEMLINLQSIKKSSLPEYQKLIDSYNLKRKQNVMIKMSRHTIAYGYYEPNSFTGTFVEIRSTSEVIEK